MENIELFEAIYRQSQITRYRPTWFRKEIHNEPKQVEAERKGYQHITVIVEWRAPEKQQFSSSSKGRFKTEAVFQEQTMGGLAQMKA
jgi:hypothetical protein